VNESRRGVKLSVAANKGLDRRRKFKGRTRKGGGGPTGLPGRTFITALNAEAPAGKRVQCSSAAGRKDSAGSTRRNDKKGFIFLLKCRSQNEGAGGEADHRNGLRRSTGAVPLRPPWRSLELPVPGYLEILQGCQKKGYGLGAILLFKESIINGRR